MTEPVLVDFNKITFPPDPSEVSGLMMALEKIVKDPRTCDRQSTINGEDMLVVSARAPFLPSALSTIAYQIFQMPPPKEKYYMVAGKPLNTPYTLVTIKHMVVIRR